MNPYEFSALMAKYEQKHVVEHFKQLSKDEQKKFMASIDGMNFNLVFCLYERFSTCKCANSAKDRTIEPPPALTTITNLSEDRLLHAGEESIKKGETAVMVVAGGQGSRLGYPHPKGMYPISPVRGKSLFRIFAEKISALSSRYGTSIPLLVMTNPWTHEEITCFFKANGFFGLDEKSVFFFRQEILPSLTPDKKLIIRDQSTIASNPDGHGGSLKALWTSGLLDKLEKQGISKIFYCHIDNPLVKVNDPLFLGRHITAKADFSLKVVKKRVPEEKVGHFVLSDGKPCIIEYTELPEKLQKKTDAENMLVFCAANIGIHFINTSFIKKLNKKGFALPYHRQIKKMQIPGIGTQEIWKFETFVFDALPFAEKICCVETQRDEEFAPLKNKSGEGSPESVREAMVKFYRNCISETGKTLPPDINIEISPKALQDRKKLRKKLEALDLSAAKDIYIE